MTKKHMSPKLRNDVINRIDNKLDYSVTREVMQMAEYDVEKPLWVVVVVSIRLVRPIVQMVPVVPIFQ